MFLSGISPCDFFFFFFFLSCFVSCDDCMHIFFFFFSIKALSQIYLHSVSRVIFTHQRFAGIMETITENLEIGVKNQVIELSVILYSNKLTKLQLFV